MLAEVDVSMRIAIETCELSQELVEKVRFYFYTKLKGEMGI
jgi:hypothetical protein